MDAEKTREDGVVLVQEDGVMGKTLSSDAVRQEINDLIHAEISSNTLKIRQEKSYKM
jgi:hypothetical protein